MNLSVIRRRLEGTIVIVTGYGQWSDVNNVLFRVVTHITITNQANTQKIISNYEMICHWFKKHSTHNNHKTFQIQVKQAKSVPAQVPSTDSSDSILFPSPWIHPFHSSLPIGYESLFTIQQTWRDNPWWHEEREKGTELPIQQYAMYKVRNGLLLAR